MNAPSTTGLFKFDNTYARLPARFYAKLPPTKVAAPRLLKLNEQLADELRIDPDRLKTPLGTEILSGNHIPEGGEPLAMAYAGHQFGGFVPQLGDGRAILLGEVVDMHGRRRDIQWKGSGPTPYSRQGDGRAALGPVLREYIISEAMTALGVPSTRSLSVVATGEMVWRETPLPGAVLVRVASSHIRVGTFQFFAARNDVDGLRALADHVIDRHYPEAREAPNPYAAMFEGVMQRQAGLMAQWLNIGFIHGVMNTDNMSIAGETIDYGPCAFMDTFHPTTVYSSIDQMGRYAYANQARIAMWNLARLVETLLSLIDPNEDAAVKQAEALLEKFPAMFENAYADGLRRKIGLRSVQSDDAALARDLLERMAKGKADFTLTFRRLGNLVDADNGKPSPRDLFETPGEFDEWAERWRARLAADGTSPDQQSTLMRSVNPAFIPRNHRVEEAIAAAVTRDDLAPFERLVAVLARPFDDQPGNDEFAQPPEPHEVVRQTFCGT